MMLLEVYGHIIIIAIGVPLIGALVKRLRQKRLEHLLLLGLDKMKSDTDALIQIQTIQGMIEQAKTSQTADPILIGYVNLHIVECQNSECPCKNESELYDGITGKFSQSNCNSQYYYFLVGSHKDYIFLNHLNKRLYEDALNKFINSPRLHIAFSFFLFDSLRNVHAALVELNVSSKKKPSIHQQFTIFRNKDAIENYIKAESLQAKDIYNQLTNVIEFERLFGECQKAIERVCTYQIEFWTQLGNAVPDLNILHELSVKIFDGTKEGEDYWAKLSMINSNYSKALNMYGNYVSQVKNNDQLGYELIDKYECIYDKYRARANSNKKSLDELVKSSDILFADDTVVLHISGNKETAGRIVKTNGGLSTVFGYSKSEVVGHFVNILMPAIYAKRHSEFLEKFFRTGRRTMFNTERNMFALNRSGCCFQIKMLVKQLPSLAEGTQYVAMIRQTQSEYDYILTDMRGVIDSFSTRVGATLSLQAQLFKDSEVNIQILAPDLIKVFSSVDKKRPLLDKFKEVGGQKLTLIIPKDFHVTAQNDTKKVKDATKRTKSSKNVKKKFIDILYREFNKDLNKHNGIANRPVTPDNLLGTTEYKECSNKHSVKCEIQDLVFGDSYKDFDPLKLRVFKMSGLNVKTNGYAELSSEAGDNPFGGSHSGGSFDRDIGLSSIELPTKEDNKGILDYVMRNEGSALKIDEIKEEREETKGTNKLNKSGEREDTKMTEVLPENVITTENKDTREMESGKKEKSPKQAQLKETAEPKPPTSMDANKEIHRGSFLDNVMPGAFLANLAKKAMMQKESSPANKEGRKVNSDENRYKKDSDKEREEDKSGIMTIEDIKTPDKSEKSEKSDKEKVPKSPSESKQGAKERISTKEIEENKSDDKAGSDSYKSTSRINQKKEGDNQSLTKFKPPDTTKKTETKGTENSGQCEEVKKPRTTLSVDNIHAKDSSSPEPNANQAQLESPQKQEYVHNPFGEILGEEGLDKIEEQKEESEVTSQLSKAKMKSSTKVNALGKPQFKVPSMLDETVDGQVKRGSIDEKKGSVTNLPDAQKLTNVFIDNRDQRSEHRSDESKRNSQSKDDLSLSQQALPLHIRQSSKGMDSENPLGQSAEKSSKLSDIERKSLDISKKPTKGDRAFHERKSTRQVRRRGNQKIVSNPKFDETEEELKELPEYKPGDEELRLRKAFLEHEKRKKWDKKKEERQKRKKKKKKEEKENSEENDKDSKSKEEKSEEEKKGGGEEGEEGKEEEEESDDGDGDENQETQSSVTSGSTGSTIRSFYSLRAAIDEKYVPSSIRNLRRIANVVFLLLIALAIVYFVMQIILFSKINQNIKNIRFSENRLNYLIDINLHISKMMIITADYNLRATSPNLSSSEYYSYDSTATKLSTFEDTRSLLRKAATSLKDAQTELSLKTSGLSSASLAKINPEDVVLDYMPVPGMPLGYTYTIWQAIMEVVVSSFRVSTMAINQVDDSTDSTVFFVVRNSLNGILLSLQKSTAAIIDETENSRQSNVFIFLLLLCGASFAMIVSTSLLIPVIKKVKMNKQDVLELFMNVKKPNINEEVTKCKGYLKSFQPNVETEAPGPEQEQEEEKEKALEDDSAEGRFRKGWEKNKGPVHKHRKFKKLSIGLGLVTFKFVFILLLMEGYFIMTYFLSSTFLNRVSSLTTEMSQLISRLPTHGLLLLVIKMAIFKKYQLSMAKQNMSDYITDFQNRLYGEEDKLLDIFSSNYDYHTSSYNDDFNTIVFSNMCSYVDAFKKTQQDCEAFNQGILQKGVYSTVIKYWDFLRQLNHDFNESAKTRKDQAKFMNDPNLKVAEKTESYYLDIALNILIEKLQSDIDEL